MFHVNCLSQQLEKARIILDNSRTNLGEIEQQATILTELAITTGKILASFPERSPSDPLNILDKILIIIKDLAKNQQEFDKCIELLVDPGPFQRFLVQTDRLWVEIKNKLSSVRSNSIYSLSQNLKQQNFALSEINNLDGSLNELKKLIESSGHYQDELVEVLFSSGNSLAKTDTCGLQQKLDETISLFNSLDGTLHKSATIDKKCCTSAKFLTDQIGLLGNIMAAKPDVTAKIESNYREFKFLLSEFEMEARKDNFPDELQVYTSLLAIKSKLARIRIVPQLAKKHIIAVAGGFSSGKSSFINSLVGQASNLLPADITPTTSIPTYVYHKPNTLVEISSFNKMGGKQILDEQILHTISHKFDEYFEIPLNMIIDRIVVNIPELKYWERISFVDTPGYTYTTAGQGEVNLSESDVTTEEVLSSHYLIWLVDCEKGTLTDTDINYIKQFLEQQKSSQRNYGSEIYLIINKSDKKPSGQHKKILEHLAGLTEKHGIPCAGIAMYSARLGKWYDEFIGKKFYQFLNEVSNHEPEWGLKEELLIIIRKYIEFHQGNAKKCESRIARLKRMALNYDGKGQVDSTNIDFNVFCTEIGHELEVHKAHEKAYGSLLRRFDKCMDRFFD